MQSLSLLNILYVFGLILFKSNCIAEQIGEEKKLVSLERSLRGHLDCTNYYSPCAIDCYHVYDTVEQNIQAFIQAVNSGNLDRLTSIFSPNIQFWPFYYPPLAPLGGICQITETIGSWFPAENNRYIVIYHDDESIVQNDNVAQLYVNIYYQDSQNNNLKYVGASINMVKNACGSWVQDLWIVTNLYL